MLTLYFLFPQTDLNQRLSVCSKLCFAIGGAPNQVAGSATAFFLQIYLLYVAQVHCACVCACVFGGGGGVLIHSRLVLSINPTDQPIPGIHGAVHREDLGGCDRSNRGLLHYQDPMDQDWQTHALVRTLSPLDHSTQCLVSSFHGSGQCFHIELDYMEAVYSPDLETP